MIDPLLKRWKVVLVVVDNAPSECHVSTGVWGAPSVAVVDSEEIGQHIVDLHNMWVAIAETSQQKLGRKA